MDWSVLFDNSMNLDFNVSVFTEYFNICVNSYIEKKTIVLYPNNKPWMNRDVKKHLKEKHLAYVSGDRERLRFAQFFDKCCQNN